MSKGNILIIDDEEKLRGLLSRIISLEDYKVFEAGNARSGLKLLEKEEIHVVISDVKLPDANGIELVPKIKSQYPLIEIIVMTAYGTIPDGVKAMKLGAFDYITKGEGEEQITPAVSRAMDKAQLQLKVQQLEKKIGDKYSFENIIGNSPAIHKAIDLAGKVAVTDTTVLLLGETGTGKEVFAQAIHYASPRKRESFVAVNCSAIPKDLLESEMFGYKAGAFTGAIKDKKGLFDEANGGTIFLDEIGEMNLDLQAKLLRVLETHSFIKSGDTKETKVNVRVIAATNRDLLKEAEKEHFRMDLYYRLSAFNIQLPSLRERSGDIEMLAQYFLPISAHHVNKRVKGMEKEFIARLKVYSFKGNIRELKNMMERAIILCEGEMLSADLLPSELQDSSEVKVDSLDLASIEKQHIRKILELTKGNKTKAAELLGIGVATLYRKIEEYKIS
ncbi:MAG TPA: sigma-54 dependent transcriptional regulator [Cytophagaceae bacterium]|nr:sigma-54 dependent transcriptional regulator [Cytophagaceae bacterium]